MYRRVLDEAGHAVAEGDNDEPVEGRGIMHFGQIRPRVDGQRRERQYGRDPYGKQTAVSVVFERRKAGARMSGDVFTEANAITGRFAVEPEGDPRQDDDQDTRNVHLDQEVALLPSQIETHLKH